MNYDPEAIAKELQDAIDLNRQVTGVSLDDRQNAYTGHHAAEHLGGKYRSEDQQDPRSTPASYVGYFLPEVAAGDPQWSETTEHGEFQEIVEAHADVVNALSRKQRVRSTVERIGVDYCLGHAAAVVYPKRYAQGDRLLAKERKRGKGMGLKTLPEEQSYLPCIKYMDPRHVVCDSTRIDEEDWRFTAHLEIRDLSELERENDDGAKWDLQAIRASSLYRGDGAATDTGEHKRHDYDDIAAMWCVHLRYARAKDLGVKADEKHTPENGYNGFTIYLPYNAAAGKRGKGAYLKPPEAWYGPHDGPHVIIGSLPVPGMPYRTSPLAIHWGAIQARAKYERAVNRAGELYKRVIAVDGVDVGKILLHAATEGVVNVPGLMSKAWAQWEAWGITPQMIENLARLIEAEDSALGLSQEARGQTSSSTATAASLAAGSTSKRMGFTVSGFLDGIDRIGKKYGWYAWHSRAFAMQANGDNYVGGMIPGELVNWDDLACRVQYHSLRHVSEQEQRDQRAELVALLGTLFPLFPQIGAYTQIDEALERIEETGLRGVERLMNYAGLSEAVSIATAGAAKAAEPTPEAKASPVRAPKPAGGNRVMENVSYAGSASKRPASSNGAASLNGQGAKPKPGSNAA